MTVDEVLRGVHARGGLVDHGRQSERGEVVKSDRQAYEGRSVTSSLAEVMKGAE